MVKRRLVREVEGEYEGRREELRVYLDNIFKERGGEVGEVCRRAGMWEGGREGVGGRGRTAGVPGKEVEGEGE